MPDELNNLYTEARWVMNEWTNGEYEETVDEMRGVFLSENTTHPPRRVHGEPVRMAVILPFELPAPFEDALIPPPEIDAPAILLVSSVASLRDMIDRLKMIGVFPMGMCAWMNAPATKDTEPVVDEPPVPEV